jgi:putative transposase
MKKKRFTEEQIISVLKEHEAGMKTGDLARKHGISEATLYNWKAKFGGMDVSDAKRLRALEEENGKLKRLLADSMLDNAALKDLLSKMYDPPCLCKGLRADDKQLHKCIRPLASGPLLRPGHDESRTLRSQ